MTSYKPTRVLIYLTTGRALEIYEDRDEVVAGFSEALRAAVPWTIDAIGATVTVNPFAVQTIEGEF